MSTAPTSTRLPMVELHDEPHTRGLGALKGELPGAQAVELPLARVAISARVADRVAEITQEETFRNPHAEHLEATYIFPLAGGAAVSAFELRVGDRVIEGIVQERGEARRTYQQALDEGRRAGLMEQERDDVFTVQVGNLPPGEEITVRITCSERLPFFDDGRTELRLPLVVAPRYIPGAPVARPSVGEGVELDTDVVPDASRITPPRLAEGFDPKVSLSIEVALAAAPGVAELACSQHATQTSFEDGAVVVALAREDEPLDRDFVLRWRLGGARLRTALLVHRTGEGGGKCYGLLSILPPARDGFLGLPRDVVFVVDRSGSMGGVKMASAARACSILLHTLGPRDRFAICAFDDRNEWMGGDARRGNRFHRADEAGQLRGDRYLRSIEARGGTELDGAIGDSITALANRRESAGRAAVIVVLTDGEIGDESRVLGRIQRSLGDARVFSVGIDTAVNTGFLTRLAALGGGTASFVVPGAALETALAAVGREIGAPLATDLEIHDEGSGLDEKSIAPAHLPDLFSGRAASVLLCMKKPGRVRVKARFTDGGTLDEVVRAELIDQPAIAHLWARARVADLEDRFRLEPQRGAEVKKEIIALSIAHTLLTRFTAFVAVDRKEIVNEGGGRRKVVQPVEMPAEWEEQATQGMPPVQMSRASVTGSFGAVTPAARLHAPGASMAPPPPSPAPASPSRPIPPMSASKVSAPPPPAKKKGGLAGLFGSLFERKEKAEVAPPLDEADDLRAAEPVFADGAMQETQDRAVKAPPARPANDPIRKALDALAAALRDAQAAIAAGRLPDGAALEAARKDLIAALASSEIGQSTPLLQRFLRSAAVELVAACAAPGATASSVKPLFDRHVAAFEEAYRKEGGFGGGGGGGSGGAFWEETI